MADDSTENIANPSFTTVVPDVNGTQPAAAPTAIELAQHHHHSIEEHHRGPTTVHVPLHVPVHIPTPVPAHPRTIATTETVHHHQPQHQPPLHAHHLDQTQHYHHAASQQQPSSSTATPAPIDIATHETQQVIASAVTEALEQEAALAMVANKRPFPHQTLVNISDVAGMAATAADTTAATVVVTATAAEADAPRKKRSKWNEHRHVYKGVTRRTCMCGQKECFTNWKQWIDLGDRKRQGYLRLGWAPCRDTPKARERTHHRDIMYRHLLGIESPRFDKDDPKRTVKQFIAYHHFPPEVLLDDNKGPMLRVPIEIAQTITSYSEKDRFIHVEELKDFYHPIPCLTIPQIEQDLKVSHHSKRERVRTLLQKTKENPNKLADDYIKIEDELSRTVKTLEDTKKALEQLKETNSELIKKCQPKEVVPLTAPRGTESKVEESKNEQELAEEIQQKIAETMKDVLSESV